jgi:DNA-directed RNA polymerase specialized sigma24 family protein
MQTARQVSQRASDLHWLAFLLTGRREVSVELAVETMASDDEASPYFSSWMLAWSRRVVIAKALAAIRDELGSSAHRTKSRQRNRLALPARDWTLDRGTTKVELESALFAIDAFPRAALLLLVFERVPIDDAAVLLDADRDLVTKARTAGLEDLTHNLAKMQGWVSSPGRQSVVSSETQYA